MAPRSRTVARCSVLVAALAVGALAAGPAAARVQGFGGGFAMQRGQGPAMMSPMGRGGRQPIAVNRVTKKPPGMAGARVANPTRGDGGTRPRPPRYPRPPIIVMPPNLPPGGPPGIVTLPPSGNGGPPPSNLAPGPAIAAAEQRVVPDEVLVSFNANVPQQAVVGIAQNQRLALLGIHRLALINTVLYRFRITDRRAVPAVINSLQADRRIATAQPNFIYTLLGAEGAAGDPGQYVLGKLRVPQAHELATGSRVLVAVIDSAVDVRHPELANSIAAKLDLVRGAATPHPHGTAMASAIAAHGRLLGVAPAARIVAIHAFDPASSGARGTSTRILDGLQYAADSGARIVNMSFTGPADPKLRDMVAAIQGKGAVLIAAAGNDGPQAGPAYPAAYPAVIAVTATDSDDRRFANANRGAYVALAAPGVDIMVAAPNGAYTTTTGTSVAAAHVSGLAALLLERDPSLTPEAVRAILTRTAHDLGPAGRDDDFGAGLVDAQDAVLALAPRSVERTIGH